MGIDDLLKEEKVFSSVAMIRDLKDNMNVKIECDANHNIVNYKA
jgi:hypothetical protein